MLFDLVIRADQTTLDRVLTATRTSENGPTFHLIARLEHDTKKATVPVTRTDDPFSALKTRRIICVEVPVVVSSSWETALLEGLTGDRINHVAVPSVSQPMRPDQRSPLEETYPNVWKLDHDHLLDRMGYFNRCCALMVEPCENAVAPVWAADPVGPPIWKRPLMMVRSAVVDNR